MGKITNKSEAEKRANEFYSKYFNQQDVISSRDVATDLEKILNDLKTHVIIADLTKYQEHVSDGSKIHGILLQTDNRQYIIVEESNPVEHRRFTIAHELGHFVLNHIDENEKISVFTDSNANTDALEVAANAFAKILLMPEQVVRYVYAFTSSIKKTAECLGIGEQFVKERLESLGVI